MFFLLLSTWILGWLGWVFYEILVTAQRPKTSVSFWIYLGLGLGLGLVNCQPISIFLLNEQLNIYVTCLKC